MNAEDLRSAFASGDRRSIGRADEIADLMIKQPGLFPEVIAAVTDENPIVRMRAADVAEKASRSSPMLLVDHKATLLGPVMKIDQQEVQWHLLPMLSRLPLICDEREQAFRFAMQCLDSPSRIVAVEALSAIFALAAGNESMQALAADAAARALDASSAALRARARKLLGGP